MRSGERGRDGGSGVTGRAPWPHADPADKGARGRPGPPPARPLCSGENPGWWRAAPGGRQRTLPCESGKRVGAGAGSESEVRV